MPSVGTSETARSQDRQGSASDSHGRHVPRRIPVNQQQGKAAELIRSGGAILGIEFGSTRIKASLIAPDTTPLASGSHAWENQLKDGVWTYDMEDVWKGLADCYASLVQDVRARYSLELTAVAAMGFSGMMHGYVALDAEGKLLVPFRTWRNNITGRACAELTPLLDFAVPQRWSIAHLYQSILEGQPHVPRIAHLTTLAGYVHWKLTGEHSMGVGEASGIFPIDPVSGDWDAARMARFDALIASRSLGWKLRDILPAVLPAGRPAGKLTAEGAKLLDPSGKLPAGIPLCPPEGDADTGMVATNAVRPRSGNVSAGTSVFAMIVLEKSLARVHEQIDIVLTPDGKPVAMAHANNGSSDLDDWIALFGQVARALGHEATPEDLYGKLLPLAVQGDPDAGGLLSINYVSGEHMTGFLEGRPLFARNENSRFTLENFMRAMCFASLCSIRTGMDILTEEEGVVIEEIRGHGGFFKVGDTGQRMMAAALNVPVSIPATAGEGGAWGMAVLAAYMLRADAKQSLPDYLDERIAKSIGKPVKPDPRDVKGFAEFFARHRKGLAVEREAVKALS
jgi:sugar (pentulose or hexulose) kinase